METIICPYCDAEVKMSSVEAEGGYCPECGAPVNLSGSLFGGSGGRDYCEEDDVWNDEDDHEIYDEEDE